jgi:hypothetical protein
LITRCDLEEGVGVAVVADLNWKSLEGALSLRKMKRFVGRWGVETLDVQAILWVIRAVLMNQERKSEV